jgi:type IV pilus assembly protein PilE
MKRKYAMKRNEDSMNAKRGFTLIEMLVVLVILSILAAVAYPNYASHITRTKRTEGQIALIEAMQQQERYHLQHNSYAEFSASGSAEEAQGFRWWSGATAAASVYELDARACPGQDIADCVEVRARPGTDKVDSRFRDPECGALTLDSLGVHAAQGMGRCWP